ncbi:hypothetical protein AX16_010401 [Volvariella volvacea WC 439]|nr:hypothetical protein AX16_010401 [Volvariella volvacea WC 439]
MVGNASNPPASASASAPPPPGGFQIGELVTIVYDLPKEFPDQSGANCEGFQKGSVVRIGQCFAPPQMTAHGFKPKETVTAQFYSYQIIHEKIRRGERWHRCNLATALEKNIAKRLDPSERSMKPGILSKRNADSTMEYYVHTGYLEYIPGTYDDEAAPLYARLKEPLSAGKELNFLLPKNTRVVVHHESYSVHNLGQRKVNGMNRKIEFVYREQQEQIQQHKSIFPLPGFMLQSAITG